MDQWCYLAHDAGLAYIELYYSKLLMYYLETQYIYIYMFVCVLRCVVLWCVCMCTWIKTFWAILKINALLAKMA